jgi:hypothetical protein
VDDRLAVDHAQGEIRRRGGSLSGDVSLAVVTAVLGLLTAGVLAVINNGINLRAGVDEDLRTRRLTSRPYTGRSAPGTSDKADSSSPSSPRAVRRRPRTDWRLPGRRLRRPDRHADSERQRGSDGDCQRVAHRSHPGPRHSAEKVGLGQPSAVSLAHRGSTSGKGTDCQRQTGCAGSALATGLERDRPCEG